ncbi:MAG: hypothetical protein HY303_20450 [Candidatus Wallbacteria bacterium]|nr:hypothetical protein [Candidatus Wallbacteria bacterium]
MHIYLLARRRNAYTTRRFVKTANLMGHELTVLDPLKCTLLLADKGPEVFYDSKPLPLPELLLGRVSTSTWGYGLAVIEQFELMNVPVVNRSLAISRALDSIRSLQLLAAAGVPVVSSVMLRSPRRLKEALGMVGGTPVVLKLLKANLEIGAILADSFQAAESTLETLWELGQNIMLQQYLTGRERGDVRVFVVDGRVLGAIRRPPLAGVFRADIHKRIGGEIVAVDAEIEQIACKATAVLGLGVAGVDLQEGEKGFFVTGVHASPGIKWIERIAKLDAARAILEFAVRAATPAAKAAEGP